MTSTLPPPIAPPGTIPSAVSPVVRAPSWLHPIQRVRARRAADEENRKAFHARVTTHLEGYDDESIGRLEELVEQMLGEMDSVAEVLDKKATAILGFALGLPGVVLPWLTSLPASPLEWQVNRFFYATAALAGLVSAGFAFWALRAQRGWSLIEQKSVFPKPPPAGHKGWHTRRRFWLHGLYKTYEERGAFNLRKGKWLRRAQIALTIAAAAVSLATAARLIIYRDKPPQPLPGLQQVTQLVDHIADATLLRIDRLRLVNRTRPVINDHDDRLCAGLFHNDRRNIFGYLGHPDPLA